jgi:hypothetical protein
MWLKEGTRFLLLQAGTHVGVLKVCPLTPGFRRNRDYDKSGNLEHIQSLTKVERTTAGGTVVKDAFSRGVSRDLTAEKEMPYLCKEDGKRFVTATQLSDYYKRVHDKHIHPSLIRPCPVKK